MNTKSSRTLRAHALAFTGLLATSLLHAGIGSAISPTNATVDTRSWFGPEIEITMHRVTAEALENAGPGAGIDDPLRVKGGDRGLLARQPQLSKPNFLIPYSGLVADGVTPLLFRISASSGLTQQTTYEVKLSQYPIIPGASFPDLNEKIQVLEQGIFRKGRKISLSPQQPDAYLVLGPVAAAEIGSNAGGLPEIKLSLMREGARLRGDDASLNFQVRKPPIILVHGYNADNSTWGSEFISKLVQDRGQDFVIPVGYGNANNNRQNTYLGLVALSSTLHRELWRQVENNDGPTEWAGSTNWAWTRYDAVGHSQGGVLLRLLCSSSGWPLTGDLQGEMVFRQPSNHHRGRFHRVVTLGSPHFGSTMAHLGYRMLERRISFGANMVGWFGNKERLLQPKFRIDQLTVDTYSLQELNNLLIPDSESRLHMMGFTIDQGRVPGPRPGLFDTLPRIFKAVHLHQGNDSNRVSGKLWGEWIAPEGSDGVVDLRSQMASANLGSPLSNSSRMSGSIDIAHAAASLVILDLTSVAFDTSRTETDDVEVGDAVINRLNGSGVFFASFPSAAQCAPLHAEMNATAMAIEDILEHINAMQLSAAGLSYTVSLNEPAESPVAMRDEIIPNSDPPAPAESLNLTLDPPEGEIPDGPVVWSALVYGPDGVTTEGLTLSASGAYGELLQLDIDASVVGEVVVSVQFPSTSGKVVIGETGVVASRPPGMLTGIEIQPDDIAMLAGPMLPLEIRGVYDGGAKVLLFTQEANTAWLSNDPTVVTVDASGRITLVAPGETTVQATYNGTYTAAATVKVLASAPLITSADTAIGNAEQLFSYQIAAGGSPVSFTARNLPEGLTLNPASGLVSGSPLYEGLSYFTVGALNADGQEGNLEVALTVTGNNQPPTAIGIDIGSVPALQPAGTLVGRLGTEDPNPLDTFSYALVEGEGDAENSLFSISGDQLITTGPLDPAVHPFCSIRLRSTDSGGLAVEQAMVLPVLGAPQITTQPQGTIVFAGRGILLEAEASGREPLTFQWQENGVDIPGENSRALELEAGAPATRSFTLRVTNPYGNDTSVPATVEVVPLGFGGWAAAFTTPESGEIQPDGDLNGDGFSNFLNYALNTDPSRADPSQRPVGGILEDAGGERFTLSHRRNKHAALLYQYEWSPDLEQWHLFTPEVVVKEEDPDGDGSTDLIEARRAIQSDEPSGFLRLKVSEP